MEEKIPEKYNHREVEPKWEKKWDEAGIYKAIDFDKKPKKYILFEFPYPSGERLHVGHGRSYTALDAMARKYRMQGFNVMLPMGWDAFGLPAENYAIKNKVNPNVVVKQNIEHAKAQAKRWGLSIDWDREVDTTDPKYYKWTQWIFVQLFKKGLAYRQEVAVNWCPFCKTNLANEEVLSDGTHERCGNKTERRMQKQWILRITKYADRLLEDLKTVDFLPKIANQQINWIGKTNGVIIDYPLIGSDKIISCYSTRPDTNFGATFVVIAPEHPMARELVTPEYKKEVDEYISNALKKSELERTSLEKEKTGVFTGIYCLNRLNNKKMPIWVSDFVVATAGTGVVVGVPAHDKRDFEFAKKHNIEIIPVVKPKEGEWDFEKGPFLDIDDALIFNSDFLDGMPALEAKEKIIDFVVQKGWGKKSSNYHLRDWVFSRQHYWGEPIPMIYCEKCKSEGQGGIRGSEGLEMAGWWPVPEEELPVELPYLEQYEPSGTGESPLAKVEEWVNTKCPHCNGPAKRETDTMPNWAGSNWYYVAYLLANKLRVQSAKCKVQSEQGNIFSENEELLKYWLPVDLYNGGMEHTTLHLLYSRFIYKFLFDIGIVPTSEPYSARRSHGMVLGPDGQKMSKSRGNVINPDEIIEAFGADTFRLYESFMGPFDQMIAWNQESLEGCSRFLKRVWNLAEGLQTTDYRLPQKNAVDSSQSTVDRLERKLNQTIKKVGEDIDNMKFNTAIAAMMELLNEMYNLKCTMYNLEGRKAIETFLLLLAPFAPHITEELWQKLGNSFSIHQQSWPKFDSSLIKEEIVTIAIQINGKLRGTIELPAEDSKTQSIVEEITRKDEKVKKYFEGVPIKKIIFVPEKLINIVI